MNCPALVNRIGKRGAMMVCRVIDRWDVRIARWDVRIASGRVLLNGSLALLLVLGGAVAFGLRAAAQDAGVPETSAENDSAVPAGQLAEEDNPLPPTNPNFDYKAEQARFEAVMDRWRETLVEMRREMILFHNGPAEDKDERREAFRRLEENGWKHFDEAFQSALLLIKNAPRESYGAAQFLLIATRDRFAADWYELSGEGAELLLRISAKDELLPEIAAVSFVSVGDFERAEPFVEQALASPKLPLENAAVLQEFESLRALWADEVAQREVDAQQGDLPRVRLRTTRGDVIVELFEDQAPNTVANFIQMVETRELEDVPFNQVLSGQIAMVGVNADPSSGYCIADEHGLPNRRHIFRGSMVMAKLPDPENPDRLAVPNTGGRQFYFAMKPLPFADREHTVFGRIVDGMHVLSALSRVNPFAEEEEKENQPEPDMLLEAEVLRKREHPYEPKIIEMSPLEMAMQGGSL